MSPKRSWRFRIKDMLDAVHAIQEYTDGMSYEQFRNDKRTVDAVIRRLMIIGEAASHVAEEITELSPDIEWRRIRGMRNILIHEYFGVGERIVWDTIQDDLPAIVEPLRQLLSSGEA